MAPRCSPTPADAGCRRGGIRPGDVDRHVRHRRWFFDAINSSRFDRKPIFTHDVQVAFRAQAQLEVGGVIIGDVPSYRADQMPYGGVKNSGVGREGLRHAMDDYTDVRVMVLTGLEL